MKKVIFSALLSSGAILAGTHAPLTNPGNFPVEKTPQFICLGSDDNFYPDGFDWIYTFLKDKKNQSQETSQSETFDGTPARMSFYVNTNNGDDPESNNIVNKKDTSMVRLSGLFNSALKDGHEIGNHTRTHNTGSGSSLTLWKKEITSAVTDLKTIEINDTNIVGFRTPYLAYGDNTFKALTDSKTNTKYLYDCSINTGDDSIYDGTNFIWPYLLDKGVDSLDALHEPRYDSTVVKGKDSTVISVQVKVGSYPGLWEVPVYKVIVPPALRKAVYEQRIQQIPERKHWRYTTDDNDSIIDSTLEVVAAHTVSSDFDTVSGKIEGMDYNMWSMPSNYGGLGLDSAQFFETLKYSLDQRLKGNRAPMTFALHSNVFYDTLGYIDEANTQWNGDDATGPRATVHEMCGAIEAFVKYALTKPEVRIVTQRDLVKWCQKPVAFKTAIISSSVKSVEAVVTPMKMNLVGSTLKISGLDALSAEASLFTVGGRQVRSADLSPENGKASLNVRGVATGNYVLKVSQGARSFTSTISLN